MKPAGGVPEARRLGPASNPCRARPSTPEVVWEVPVESRAPSGVSSSRNEKVSLEMEMSVKEQRVDAERGKKKKKQNVSLRNSLSDGPLMCAPRGPVVALTGQYVLRSSLLF